MSRFLFISAFIILIQKSSLNAYNHHHIPSHFGHDLSTDFEEQHSWDENEIDEDDIDDNDSKRTVSYEEVRQSSTCYGARNHHEYRVMKLQAYGHAPLNKVTVRTTKHTFGPSHQHARITHSVTFHGPTTLIEVSNQRYDLRRNALLRHPTLQRNSRIKAALADKNHPFIDNINVISYNIHLESRSHTPRARQKKATHKISSLVEDNHSNNTKKELVLDKKITSDPKGLCGKIVKIP